MNDEGSEMQINYTTVVAIPDWKLIVLRTVNLSVLRKVYNIVSSL